MSEIRRQVSIGAEIVPGEGVHVRVWAPACRSIEAFLRSGGKSAAQRVLSLEREDEGYFSGLLPGAVAGDRYGFRLNGEERVLADPASRFQPDGPHGLSQVIDPSAFAWTDKPWRGVRLPGQVIYELHVGTFTREGTFEAAERELPALAELGVTVVEVMPVADFPGRFGWGYDGVCPFAPSRLYGQPDDFRRFVNSAHSLGLAVILDVVYNHLGPDGNYLRCFSPDYFTDRHANDWGEAINFDGENSKPVREFFVTNAEYWIREFHVDGFRLDATHQIFDSSREHILAEIGRSARAAAGDREILVIPEHEGQEARLVRGPEAGGYGLDAVWNDDFHHSARVAMTGRRDAYYADYLGAPQELVSAVKRGFLFQGQASTWRRKAWGTPALDLPPEVFVTYIENHDQVANSETGQRLPQLTSMGRFKAMSALVLLSPGTPLIFQGQEFASSKPFFYFADHHCELGSKVRAGRGKFVEQFFSPPDPTSSEAFERCKLDLPERKRNAPVYMMYRDLLRLRRTDPVFRTQRKGAVDGVVLGPQCFVLRFFGDSDAARLLLINLGEDLRLAPATEPLLAPPAERTWRVLWSSAFPKYGGTGQAALEVDHGWRIPGSAAVVLTPS